MKSRHIIIAVFTTALWGLNGVVSKVGMNDLSPLLYVASRCAVALPLIPFVAKPDISWAYIVGLGFVWGVLQWSCMVLALQLGASVGICAMLLQSAIFFTMIFSAVFLKERPTVFQIIGLFWGLGGILLIGWEGENNTTPLGFLLALMAAASWGFGNVLAKKAGSNNSLGLIVWTSAVPVLPLLLLSWLWEDDALSVLVKEGVSWTGMGCILYAGLISNLGAGTLWMRLFRIYSATQVMAFSLLVPLFSILFGMFFLGERLTLSNILAGALIAVGLIISQKSPRSNQSLRLEDIINQESEREIEVGQLKKHNHLA